MHHFNKFRGTKGWLWLYERQLRLAAMNNQKEAERRARILIFWEKHGNTATVEACRVSRRTLYRWQQSFQTAPGKLNGLDKKSTAPKRRRSRHISSELEMHIITLRRDHHRLGKRKIAVLCGISESRAGRILSDLKKRVLLPQYRKVSVQARTGRMIERKQHKRHKIRRSEDREEGTGDRFTIPIHAVPR